MPRLPDFLVLLGGGVGYSTKVGGSAGGTADLRLFLPPVALLGGSAGSGVGGARDSVCFCLPFLLFLAADFGEAGEAAAVSGSGLALETAFLFVFADDFVKGEVG